MNVTYCDWCGKPIDNVSVVLRLIDVGGCCQSNYRQYDFCNDCAKSLKTSLKLRREKKLAGIKNDSASTI